jgi:protein arginine kinase activator
MKMKKTICAACGQKPASFFYRESVNGKKKEISLCHECAQKAGLEKEANSFSSFFFPASLFPEAQEEKCPLCGMRLSEIQKSGKFGCSACFDSFAKKLDLSPFVGKGYAEKQDLPEREEKEAGGELEELKKSLREAVQKEEYEKAAALRDQIRALEAN